MGPQSLRSSAKTVLILLAVLLVEIPRARAAAIHSEELRHLKCFLHTSPVPCNEIPDVAELPERLQKMYLNFSDGVKRAVWDGMLEVLMPNKISELPAFFINLIPMNKLSKLNGSSIGAIVSKDPKNLAVLRKLSTLLTTQMWAEFVGQLKTVPLPTASQEILGKMLAVFLPHPNNWTFEKFEILSIGTPLVAHLPPDFLDNLDAAAAPKFLFHLRGWYWHSMGSATPWHNNSWSVLRRWARLAVKTGYPSQLSTWTPSSITSNSFFLDGAMPDELQQLPTWHLGKDSLAVNWDRLQARVLFNKIYPTGILTEHQFLKVFPFVQKLAPRDLQRFSVNETTFMKMSFTEEMSFITAKQVVEALIAQAVARGHMVSDDPVQWKKNISYLGSYVFALPPHKLKYYLNFKLDVLPDIDSPHLLRTQARYLTADSSYVNLMVPETILSLSGNLLHTLDSKTVALARVGEMSHRVKLHLLAAVPPGAPVRSLAVLQKVRDLIGTVEVLENMLSNRSPEQFFSLLLPKEVARFAEQISQALSQLAGEEHELAIKRLPNNVVSTLLSVARRKVQKNGEGWNEDTLLKSPSSLFILGLTCSDVDAIDSTDVVAVLQKYNSERIAVGKEFPKDLQYCAQLAVIRYVATKTKLSGMSYSGVKLFDHLDVPEIFAVGGYVFASLTVKVISQATQGSAMLEAIGTLSVPEILAATSGNADEFAQLFVKELTGPGSNKLMLAHLLRLGNLIHFLDAEDVTRIDADGFRQFLELQDGHGVWKTMCSSLDTRVRWGHLIEAAFGPVENWTAGILVTLGDFLAVLPVEKLDKVPFSSWQAAADSLVDRTRYHVQLQWSGELKSLMLFEVCGKLTDEAYPAAVRGLARRYLLAVQSLLQTVVPAGRLLSSNVPKSSMELELELAPLNKPLGNQKFLNQSEGTKTAAENKIAVEEMLSLNTVGAEVMQDSEIERLRRDSTKKELKLQYGDVLRSKVTGGSSGVQEDVQSETPSPTTTYTELHAVTVKVSCEAIRASGPVAGLGLKLEDVEGMSLEELEDCLEVLGMLSLQTSFKQRVWMLVRKGNLFFNLADLGSLLSGLSVDDLQGVSLDQKGPGALDILAALSAEVTDDTVLEKIVQLFSDANSKTPHPGLGMETMAALGKVACKLPVTLLRQIARSKEVFYASAVLADIPTCDGLCLRELARQMLQEQALGPIVNWTAEDVRSLGVLAAGISAENWSMLRKENNAALSGITPSAIKCMETETLKAFTVGQLEMLTPAAVAAVSTMQMAALSDRQRYALNETEAMEQIMLQLVAQDASFSSSHTACFPLVFIVTVVASFM